jgi:hypothetical protein
VAQCIQIGAPSEQNSQIEQDNPGKQTQGQTEGKTPASARAGNQLTHPKLRFGNPESNALAKRTRCALYDFDDLGARGMR